MGLLLMLYIEIRAFVGFQDEIFARRIHLDDLLPLLKIFTMIWLLESLTALRLPHEDAFSTLS